MLRAIFVVGCLFFGIGIVCYCYTIPHVGRMGGELWSDRGNGAMLIAAVLLLLGLVGRGITEE
ncbi:MAG: hypothetical protein ACOC8E_03770 [Planctomycetota bacterium]